MSAKGKSFKPMKVEPEKPKAKFKTVALPLEAYTKARDMAEREQRSIARQISVIIDKVYDG